MNSRALTSSITFLLLTLSAFAQNDLRRMSGMSNGSLTVTVRDASGKPAVDARVEVRDTQMGQVVKAGYTNVGGIIELSGLSYGVYDVAITKGLSQVIEHTEVRSMAAALSISLSEAGSAEAGNKSTVSVAQYKVPGKARKELDKARKAVNERKLEDAEARISKALDIYPKYAEALTLRAILKMDRGDLESAAADLDQALQHDPADATTYLVYGANLNMQSKFDQAIQSLERGITLDPGAWQGYFEMGKAQVGKKDYSQAMKYLDKAQAMVNFEYPPLHLVKAHALLALKDYPQAMQELQVFLDKSPQDPRSEGARKTLEEVRAYLQR